MKLNNTYYAKRRDQILIVANAIIITICAVGSIWGMIRIGELKSEQEKLCAAHTVRYRGTGFYAGNRRD